MTTNRTLSQKGATLLRSLIPALFFLLPLTLRSQNTPCAAISLPNNMSGFQTYSTQGLSNSGVPHPGCGAPIGADIWFAVTAPPSGDMDIATLAGTMVNAAMAVYLGPCGNPTLLACTDDDNCGNTIMPVLQFDNLIPGQTYYIRIWPEGGGGTFQIRITDGDPPTPPINLVPTGSATQSGPDCIQLTTTTTNQSGCAWAPNQVDFSQPFTNTVSLNFGTIDANGADGICMVYHTAPTGAATCGVGGGGIGSGGIPNSFIIEFDTWDNGAGMGDIVQDHLAVNINGVMTAPVYGPIALGNIEDGQDHIVSFSWNPANNSFSITFDGIPFLSATNYNIIANAFGGQTMAWCGFTGSTGASTNNQFVCSVPPLILPAGSQTEVDVEICQGELYFAGGGFQSTSGTYFDFFPSFNGCDSIIVTNLTVLPSSTTPLNEIVCAGDCVTIGNATYCNTGIFQNVLTNYLGCDSTVILNLLVLDPLAVIAPPLQINCDNPAVGLNGANSTQGPGMSYLWTGPSPGCIVGNPTAPLVSAVCPGVYTLTVSHTAGSLTCTSSTQVTVTANLEVIAVQIAPPDTIDCGSPCITLSSAGSPAGPGYVYSWDGPNGFTSNLANPQVCEPGLYTLTIENSANGCMGMANVTVTGATGQPLADAGPDTLLNCLNPSITLVAGSSPGGNETYDWLDGTGQPIGTGTSLTVQSPGNYILLVTDPASGCTAQDTVVVGQDASFPTADAGPDQTLDCTVASVQLDGGGSDTGPTYQYQWLDEQGNVIGTNLQVDVADAGTYSLVVTNSQNGCTDTAQVSVVQDVNAPVSDPGPDQTLDCAVSSVTLNGANSSTGPGITYAWLDDMGMVLGNGALLNVNTPGTYTLLVTDAANNCEDEATVTVALDTLAPIAFTGPDTSLTCYFPSIVLGDSTAPPPAGWQFSWENANGDVLGSEPFLDVSEPDTYTLTVLNAVNGCTASQIVEVVADNALPVADPGAGGTLTCIQSSLQLDGSGSSSGPDLTYTWYDPNGQPIGTDPNATASEPGDYLLEVLNTANGCLQTATVNVQLDTLPPLADAGAPQTLNCYQPSLQLDAGATGNVQYEWFDNLGNTLSQMPELTVNGAGLYFLLATDPDNGCSAQDSILISEDLLPPVADAGTDQVLDCGATSVTLDGSGSSSGPDLEYEWTNGNGIALGTDPTLEVDAADEYILTLTDLGNGCTAGDTTVVQLDANAPVADAGPNAQLTCSVFEVTLDGSGSSSGPDIQLSWENPDGQNVGQTGMIDVDLPGIYTLTVTNTANNCSSISTVAVTIDTLSPLADAGPNLTLNCLQPSVTLGGAGTSLGPNYTYQWTDGNNMLLGNQPSLPVSNAGAYVLVVQNTQNGCIDSDLVNIQENFQPPIAEAGNDLSLSCNEPAGILDGSASSTGPIFTYAWTDSNGNLLGSASTLPVDLAGTYTLLVTNLMNGCAATDEVNVSADFTTPTVDAGPDELLNCYSPSGTLDGSGSSMGAGYTYQWLDPNGQIAGVDPVLPVDAPGIYQLIVTYGPSGCSATASAEVTADLAAPSALAGSDQTINCASPGTVLNGNGSSVGPAFQYQWFDPNGDPLGNDLLQNVALGGAYQLQVTNTVNGCTATDETLVLEDFATPTAEAGSDLLLTCSDPAGTLDGSSSSTGQSLIYVWEDENGNFVGSGLIVPIDQPGNYTLTVLNTANGCSASDEVSVGLDQELPVVQLGTPGLLTCVQLTATFDPSGSSVGAPYAYEWIPISGGAINAADTLAPTVGQAGVYQLIITNEENGCSVSAEITVGQDIDPPTADAGPSIHLNCFAPEGVLSAANSTPAGSLTYEWSTFDGQILNGSNAVQATVGAAGSYVLTVTDTGNGCTDTQIVEVTASLLENMIYELSPPPCFDDPGSLAFLEVSGGVPPYLYSIDGGESFSQQSLFAGLTPGSFDLVVQDADGCTLEESATLVGPEEVLLTVEPEVKITLGSAYQLEAQTNVLPDAIAFLLWSPAIGLSCNDCLEPVAAPLNTTTYTVELIDENGCPAEARVTVKVDRRKDIYAPNIFSPNGDGENDRFTLFARPGLVAEIHSLELFTRWGESVFLVENFQPNDPGAGWDGRFRGEALNPGVFAWLARIEFIDGTVEWYQGDVTLVR